MKSVPQTSSQLKGALAAICPALPRDCGAWGESVLQDAGPTWNSLRREFALYLERNNDQFPDRQLRRLADLVVRCLDAGGPLAAAMKACIVEPARQQAFGPRFAGLLAEAAGK